MSVESRSEVEDADAAGLAALGYKQELHRGMSGFSNFAISFSIISILAGCITSYNIALKSGGPSAINIGWPLVGVFVLCVALAMAEVCSKYPTAGGLYFWAGRLAKRNKREWAWFVGWFNFLGEVAVTAAIEDGIRPGPQRHGPQSPGEARQQGVEPHSVTRSTWASIGATALVRNHRRPAPRAARGRELGKHLRSGH